MKVVVIGAGPAGLVTCKTLLEAATEEFPFDPVILEQEDDIGGTFRYRSYEVFLRFSPQEMPATDRMSVNVRTQILYRLSSSHPSRTFVFLCHNQTI